VGEPRAGVEIWRVWDSTTSSRRKGRRGRVKRCGMVPPIVERRALDTTYFWNENSQQQTKTLVSVYNMSL